MSETRTRAEGTLPGVREPGAHRRRRRGRTLLVIGIACLALALAFGAYAAWQLWGTGLTTRAAQSELRPRFELSVGTKVPEEAPARVARVPGRAVAILRIPAIDLDYVVVEGTDTESLKKGPGHYPWTSYPWEPDGRVGIAGHRTTYGAPFWSLNELEAGDRIVLATEYGIFEYRVVGSRIILPSNAAVLHDTERPTLVLTTCHPRFSAAERLVVFAVRVDSA